MANSVRISEDVSDKVIHGFTAVGGTAVQVASVGVMSQKGVQIKATSTNTHAVYIGRKGVTTANGFELAAGEGVFVPVADISTVYAIGGAAAQEIRWLVV